MKFIGSDYGRITKVENGRCYYKGYHNNEIMCIDYHNAKIRLENVKANRHEYKTDEAWERSLSISQAFVDALEKKIGGNEQ